MVYITLEEMSELWMGPNVYNTNASLELFSLEVSIEVPSQRNSPVIYRYCLASQIWIFGTSSIIRPVFRTCPFALGPLAPTVSTYQSRKLSTLDQGYPHRNANNAE